MGYAVFIIPNIMKKILRTSLAARHSLRVSCGVITRQPNAEEARQEEAMQEEACRHTLSALHTMLRHAVHRALRGTLHYRVPHLCPEH